MLRETASQNRVPDANLLMLGRAGIGKRTLVNALRGFASPSVAAALAAEERETHADTASRTSVMDYAYFGVRDPVLPESEVAAAEFTCTATCSVSILEDAHHESLFLNQIAGIDMHYCAAVVCVDMREPWTIMGDLMKWLSILHNMCTECLSRLAEEEQDKLRERVRDTLAAASKMPAQQSEGAGDDGAADDSAAGELAFNIGIPLVVVVTRSDGASALESQGTIGWSDTIEMNIRHACLSYGAAVVYTMVQPKNTRNVELFYGYLMHRMFGYSFEQQAVVPSRDALFIPSGWDAEDKLDAKALHRPFESVVTAPPAYVPVDLGVEECDDMWAFLRRAQATLQKVGGAPPSGERLKSGVHASDKDTRRRQSIENQHARSHEEKASEAAHAVHNEPHRNSVSTLNAQGGVGIATDNASLANFFQNLLTRSSSTPPGANPSTQKLGP